MPAGAERQLEQVTARQPDHLAARRVLVADPRLAQRYPRSWSTSSRRSRCARRRSRGQGRPRDRVRRARQVGSARPRRSRRSRARGPHDLALLVRIGDGHRKLNDLDGALAWYARAGKLSRPSRACPASRPRRRCSMRASSPRPTARTRCSSGIADDLPAAEQALGVDRAAPGQARRRRVVPAASGARGAAQHVDLARADRGRAGAQGSRRSRWTELERALAAWPRDGQLHYLAGVAYAMQNQTDRGARAAHRIARCGAGLCAGRAPRSARSMPAAA